MPHQDRLNIAVFIDFDNIEIGVKNTLGQQFDVGTILDAIKERGEVVTKIAYADWTRAGEYSRALTQHAIRLVQRNLTPGGDKNGADINLALDALEMVFTHEHINAYVIVGGDSDFLSLVEKLKQYDKKVFVVGGRQFTSVILQRNCHEFIAYENLSGVRKSAYRSGRPGAPPSSTPLAQAYPIVRRALKILADREVSPQAGLLKSTLLQLDSTFSERNYGASSFFDFVDKLSRAGFVVLRHSGRSLIVELNDGFAGDDGAPAATAVEHVTSTALPASDGAGERPPIDAESAPVESAPVESGPVEGAPAESFPAEVRTAEPAPVASFVPRESNASGVERAGRILGGAANARWPMYLRNVKQLLRQADGGFDERRYGFGGLMDLLKACQREGLVRIERDHRGGLRVFRGPQLRITAEERRVPVLPQDEPEEQVEVVEAVVVEAQPIAPAAPVVVDMEDIDETGPPPNAPIPIDHTANRLGRAKPRKPRLRALHPGVTPIVPPPAPPPSRTPRTPAKKAAAAPPRKGRRPRKPSSDA